MLDHRKSLTWHRQVAAFFRAIGLNVAVFINRRVVPREVVDEDDQYREMMVLNASNASPTGSNKALSPKHHYRRSR
jgi:hypothetical protein